MEVLNIVPILHVTFYQILQIDIYIYRERDIGLHMKPQQLPYTISPCTLEEYHVKSMIEINACV